LATPACHGRVFNVGSDQPMDILGLARLVRETLHSRSEIVFVPYREAFGPGFDDLRDRQPDLTRIREAIDFRATTPLAQTIRDLAADLTAACSHASTSIAR
jgi:UDP-glucose 4-epimerase